MVILIGNKKIKAAVFISGAGTNLESLIKFSKKIKKQFTIKIIIYKNLRSKSLKFSKIFD